MYLVRPYIIKDISTRNLIWRIPGVSQTIYLTFDDGPIPEVTPILLDTLSHFSAKATFFCVGDNIRKHPELFDRIVAEGHVAGNHTFNHFDGWKKTATEYRQNVDRCTNLSGSRIFRPPYGRITPWQINQLKQDYYIVLWSVLSGDYDINTSPERCLKNVLRYTRSGSIVVFHDNIKALPRVTYTLPRFLEHFTKLGYSFEALTPEVLQKALRHNWLNASERLVNRMVNQLHIPFTPKGNVLNSEQHKIGIHEHD